MVSRWTLGTTGGPWEGSSCCMLSTCSEETPDCPQKHSNLKQTELKGLVVECKFVSGARKGVSFAPQGLLVATERRSQLQEVPLANKPHRTLRRQNSDATDLFQCSIRHHLKQITDPKEGSIRSWQSRTPCRSCSRVHVPPAPPPSHPVMRSNLI